jgi:hypothetical protein
MKRLTVAALAAATLISATAIAGTLAQVESTSDTTRQRDTRWSADEPRDVPSVSFVIASEAAFVLP